MKNKALLLTAYEHYGIGENEFIKYFIAEEVEVSADMIGDYNEYLTNNGYEPFYEDLEEMLWA